jgi:hypothetical protein
MSLYITIDHSDYVLPDSAPVATLLKHLSNLRSLEFTRLGDDYVYLIGKTVSINLSNQPKCWECISAAEYEKRLKALRRAIPAAAGPDAHGRNITMREV